MHVHGVQCSPKKLETSLELTDRRAELSSRRLSLFDTVESCCVFVSRVQHMYRARSCVLTLDQVQSSVCLWSHIPR
eukprot:6491723-Amphidinium_carterae.1